MLIFWNLLIACAAGAPPPCDGWSDPVSTGTLEQQELTEASGLVASRLQPGLLWSHNDRGGAPRLYALSEAGEAQGGVDLWVGSVAVSAVDWEDLAVGAAPSGEAALFVGDVGDNKATRSSLTVWRVPEPTPVVGNSIRADAEALHLRLPDGPVDVEGIAVDPLSNRLLLFTKEPTLTRVYAGDAVATPDSDQTLELIATIPLGRTDAGKKDRVTAADFSPDGLRLLLRTKGGVRVYDRTAGQSLAELLLDQRGCSAPAPIEAQGEAVAAFADGFMTTSEGAGSPLWRVAAP